MTALSGVFHRDGITWISAGMNDTEREIALSGRTLAPEAGQRMCFVSIPSERYDAYYNRVANRILDDLVATVQPREMTLVAAFTPRGGISTTVTCTHEAKSREG